MVILFEQVYSGGSKMPNKIDYTSIEMVHGSIWFCQNGFYERSSVLAYQPFRQLVQSYPTFEAAIAEHPEAEVIDCEYERHVERASVPDCAPDWFDPSFAGEVWREDDWTDVDRDFWREDAEI
jgi:hypothetical protein